MKSAELHAKGMKTLKEFSKYTFDKLKDIHAQIDSTAIGSGGRAHRCDFTHDPRVQGIKTASENPNKWFKIKNITDIKNTKIITQLHQIQDVAASKIDQTVNGHKITQEMIDKAREAVEQMKNGKMPNLKDFVWTTKNGPNMSNPAANNTIWKNLKTACRPSNLHKAGKVGAKGGAIFSVATSSIKNIYRLCRKRTTIAEAGIDVGKDTISGTAGGYVGSMAGYGATVLIVACASNPAGWVIITSSIAASLVAGGITTVLTKKGLNKTEEYIRTKI